MAPRRLGESTGYLLARLGRDATRRFTAALAEPDLRPTQFAILVALDEAGTAAQAELSHLLCIDRGQLVRLIDELELRGSVLRSPDPDDRRRHAVSLTEAGRRRLELAWVRAAPVEAELMEPLGRSEREDLRRLLAKLLAGTVAAAAAPR